jgi:hypothetical protein
MSVNGKHDQPRSIDWWADEWGVDKMALRRRIIAKFGDTRRKFKAREAFDAFFLRSEAEEARRRKNVADAEASEIDTLNKKGQFVFRDSHANSVEDLATQTRTTVEAASYISKENRKRLLKALLEIKPSIAETSHK